MQEPNLDHNFKTPMMLQYLELKKQHPDCILFFRLGDFYEMFLDDAYLGAKVLDITLTARSRGKDGKIPMAGVPYHAVDSYLSKLVFAGYKVAICDQTSLPDGKGLVDRDVTRIITPGTNLNEKSLDKKSNNYVIALSVKNGKLSIVACDVGTGDIFFLEEENKHITSQQQTLDDFFAKLKPTEAIVSPKFFSNDNYTKLLRKYDDFFFSPYMEWNKFSKFSEKKLLNRLGLKSFSTLNLSKSSQIPSLLNILLSYLEYTQKVNLSHLKLPTPFVNDYLEMDRSTILNLELLSTLNGNKNNSLLSLIDETKTAMGGRMLKNWLVRPLADAKKIITRQNVVEQLVFDKKTTDFLTEKLKRISDLERLISRLSLNFGTPRDLSSLKESLNYSKQIADFLSDQQGYSSLITKAKSIQKVFKLIDEAIIDEPPLNPKGGEFVKDNVDKKLDELRSLSSGSRAWMENFEKQEREKTKISSLKVKYNKVFGFYIEISKANLNLVPKDYERKQTLVNAERFVTDELKHHEQIVLEAEEITNQIEYEIFLGLVKDILVHTKDLQRLATELSNLDCLLSFAMTAQRLSFTRPTITDKNILEIEQGRHPVVEQIIEKYNFVPNDLLLNQKDQQLIIITGPNMAGKSVFMRQTAIIVLLAHIGSFVPARSATIGLTDKIFVRSGASDDISGGLSTFMVEMTETSRILNQATSKSLVIMDEIGRGTSTYDGISIAWSVAEKLIDDNKNTPKTLFATHYHELQALEKLNPEKVSNFHMAISSHNGEPVFLYTFTKGGASHSFGIEVARLAGLPTQVITRAKQLLVKLEQSDGKAEIDNIDREQQTLLDESSLSEKEKRTIEQIRSKDLNKITPLEALNFLEELKNEL